MHSKENDAELRDKIFNNESKNSNTSKTKKLGAMGGVVIAGAALGVAGNIDREAEDVTNISNEQILELAEKQGLVDLESESPTINSEELAVDVFKDKFERDQAEAMLGTAIIYSDSIEFNPFVVHLKGGEGLDYIMRFDEESQSFLPVDMSEARIVHSTQDDGNVLPDTIQGKFNWVPPQGEEPGYFTHASKQIAVGRSIPTNGTEQGIEILKNAGFDVSRYEAEIPPELIEARELRQEELGQQTGADAGEVMNQDG